MNIQNEISLMYNSGVSIRQISKITFLSPPKIYKNLKEANIIPNRGFPDTTCKIATKLTSEQIEIVDGLLLGDGSLEMRGKTPKISLTTIQKEWANSVMNRLPFSFRFHTQPARIRKTKTGVIINSKETYQIQSKVDVSLGNFYARWYPKDKIIPNDLVITPIVMREWFCGDGSTTRDENRVKLTFCTDGFNLNDCEILAAKIFSQTGVKISIRLLHKNPRLYVSKIKSVNLLLDFMKQNTEILPCFLYKWKYATYAR